jgi:hypothetical protein
MTRKKPSTYYTCDPTKELIRYTALTAGGCAALLGLWLAVGATGELLHHLGQQSDTPATRAR